MPVDTGHAWCAIGRQCPGGTRDAGGTTEVEDGPWRGGDAVESMDHPVCRKQVQRCVEQRERRTLAGAVEGATDRLTPSLDVGGRERPQRARHLLDPQIGKVPPFE